MILHVALLTPVYKATLNPERELHISTTSQLHKSAETGTKMATSFSSLSLALSLPPTKYIPYVPRAPKPKPKPKTKVKPKTKPVEHNPSEASSSTSDAEWLNIDDFPMALPESNVLRSLDPEVPAPAVPAPVRSTDRPSSLY